MARFDPSAARGLVARGAFRRWALVASLARLPSVMAPFALLLVGREATGEFGRGAWLVSAYALGAAAAAPARGRALDRAGLPAALGRVLAGEAIVLGAFAAAAAARAPFALLLALALALGVVPAGVSGGVRALLASIARGPSLESAFAIEASMFELLWVAGPLVVGLTAALGAPLASVGVMALSALAAAALAGGLPGRAPSSGGPGRAGGLVRLPGVGPVVGMALCLGVGWGAVEAALPPRLEQIGAGAAFWGVLSALLASSSACGGLLCALAPPAGGEAAARARLVALAAAWAGLLLPTAWAGSPAALALWFTSAGFVLAPLSAQLVASLQRALPPTRHAEGFAVYGAAWSAGLAIGTALAGLLLGPGGPRPLLVLAALSPVAAALVAAGPRRALQRLGAGSTRST
ncbi:MAG TPA: hypothetical protein VFS43_17980 [Polyangiaceae bacterium]|nr:hypothetical protein [Polyangiaceae bacterium]